MQITLSSSRVRTLNADEKPYISVVIPVYNEERNIFELYDRLNAVMSTLGTTYEILFIDDGSTDGTLERINRIKDGRVRAISFQRNFGKAAALSCGFSNVRGEVVITMDGDLQDDPKEVPKFLEALKSYYVISGWKFRRQDPLSKTIPSRVFNWLTRLLTGVNIHDFNCGLKAFRRDAIKDINLYGELHRYIPVLAHWKGYTVGEIKVEHHQRAHGRSKYGYNRLFKGFLDLITIIFLTSYLRRPLHLFGSTGFAFIASGVAICLYLSSLWLGGARIGDRPLLTLGILLMTIGVQFIAVGLIGELIVYYLGNGGWVIRKEHA
jgi:glycosyltransferase involved in cell wall biosynthesis